MKDKDTYILGISAFSRDSAAALIKNGEIVAAAQEERFSRKKHDPSFPERSIEYCLSEAGVSLDRIDIIAFYGKPSLNKFNFKETLIFPEHQLAHAASAYYPSSFDSAAILTIDGPEEGVVASFGKALGNRIELFHEIRSPHSLGLLYSAFTRYCGFGINSGESKLMGLASYGEPGYVNVILENLITLRQDGSILLNLEYFNPRSGAGLTNENFHRLFGGPPRGRDQAILRKHKDLARSVQVVAEMAIMKMADRIHKETGMENLCLAGDVALNCAANGKLLRKGPFRNIWVQPASTDAGGALGAALLVWHEHLNNPREVKNRYDGQRASLLGPSFPDEDIERYLREKGIFFEKIPAEKIPEVVSGLLGRQNVIGWFQGRMEFGPRALGSRSIIGDPRSGKMRSIINRTVKFRESFRPFAPSVLLEKAAEYFDIDRESPYMLFVSPVKKGKYPEIPAVTHIDRSARIQTVKREDNPLFYDMIQRFHEDHDCPVVLNTSFNVRGEPIVCSPEDAYKCFMKTDMDYLMMGSFLIGKKKQNNICSEVKENSICVYC